MIVILYQNWVQIKMKQQKAQGQNDELTNLLIRSKKFINEGVKYDHKLNYYKVYDNPQQYEVSYVDALANLEEIKNLFKKRINDKNPHYNFFLDNTDSPDEDKPIVMEDYARYLASLDEGKVFAYTLNNTWTKGKEFFFISKGCVLKVEKIYEDRIFADVCYKGQIGLMKLEELKIILADDDNGF